MAKKKENPAEMPVEDRLKNLFQLQTILTEIDRIRTLRGELPLEVEDLEDTIEGLKTRISKTEAEIADLRAKINEYKGKIELANSQLATYKEQMDNVRNNREYDLLNKEIEFQTLEIELCNKRIREAQGLERGREEASSNHVSCRASSASVRTAATVLASFTCSVMPVVVASPRFHLSASSMYVCARRSSFANIADVSSSTQNWLVSSQTHLQRRSQSAVHVARRKNNHSDTDKKGNRMSVTRFPSFLPYAFIKSPQ